MTLQGKTYRNTYAYSRSLQRSDFPGRLSDDALFALLTCIRTGNDKESAISEIIKSHVRLAVSIVDRYVASYNCQHLIDDLDGAAIEAVVVAGNRLDTLEHDNVTGYIVKSVHGQVTEAIRKSQIVVTPRGRKRIKIVQLDGLDNNADAFMEESDAEGIAKKNSRQRVKTTTISNEDSFVLREFMDSLPRNQEERDVVDLKIQGYADQEVADILEIPKKRVFSIRHSLKRKYFGKSDN